MTVFRAVCPGLVDGSLCLMSVIMMQIILCCQTLSMLRCFFGFLFVSVHSLRYLKDSGVLIKVQILCPDRRRHSLVHFRAEPNMLRYFSVRIQQLSSLNFIWGITHG